jgi:hypothetical protein
VPVGAAGAYFGHLQAAGRSELTIRSYGMDLLRWFRFLRAIGVAWNHAVRSDARNFCRWLQVAGKPVRPHWRERGAGSRRCCRGLLIHRRPARIARRCCAAFTIFTWRLARGRWPIRSRWTGHAGTGGPMLIAIRWSLSVTSAAGCTGRRCRPGYRAVSRMRSSTGSSRRCPRTGTGPWWRSMSLPGHGHRSCCR